MKIIKLMNVTHDVRVWILLGALLFPGCRGSSTVQGKVGDTDVCAADANSASSPIEDGTAIKTVYGLSLRSTEDAGDITDTPTPTTYWATVSDKELNRQAAKAACTKSGGNRLWHLPTNTELQLVCRSAVMQKLITKGWDRLWTSDETPEGLAQTIETTTGAIQEIQDENTTKCHFVCLFALQSQTTQETNQTK
jgi:hypothetical protein